MKTWLAVILAVVCCMPAAFAQVLPRTLVVYYSRTGHTRGVAEKLIEAFQADTEELVDKRKRTGPIGFARAGKDAIAKNLTDLEPLEYDPTAYDIILIGTPSWYGNMTPAVRTFVAEHDISGKCVGVFGTTHLTGVENALKQLAEAVSAEKAASIPTLPLRERDLKEDVLTEKIASFYIAVMESCETSNTKEGGS